MGNCARLSNYLQRVIVHVVAAVNTVQLKDTWAIWSRVTESGQDPRKLRSERNRAHDSSFSISTEVARL